MKPRNTKLKGLLSATAIAGLAILAGRAAYGQDGEKPGLISGSVLDIEFGGTVANANVTIVENQMTTTATMGGNFLLTDVPPGIYTVVVTSSYYKTSRVEEVEVQPGQVTRLEIPMYGDTSDVIELEAVTTKAKVLESSELGTIAKRREAPGAVEVIGAEAFSRLGLGDAADAMSKVSGASIVDGKYVVMRGLSDRYNNTTLNGSTIPSSDPNRKAVQLDQFPSGLIDVIQASKTFTPDKSGEFTGGSVDIQTKAFPDRFFFNGSFGFSYNTNATGEEIYTYPGGGDDWLGRDDGTRALPELAKNPDNLNSGAPEDVRDELANSFTPVMSPTRDEAPLNQSWSISLGDNLDVFGKRFGYVTSLTYSREFTHNEDALETRYETRLRGDEWLINPLEDFVVDRSKDSVNIGALANFSIQLTENNELGLKNYFSQSGDDVATFQEGSVRVSEDIFLRESRLHYTERNITSHQLYGKHLLAGLGRTKIDWDISTTSSSQDEPDFRLFFDRVRLDNYPDPDPEDWGFPVGSINQRLFRELQEDNDEYGLDLTVPVSIGDANKSYLKFGYRSIESARDYDETALGYGRDTRGRGVNYTGDRDSFLAPDNVGFGPDGLLRRVIVDVTDFVPTYEGDREITAMYAMADLTFSEKLRLVGGARQEDTSIDVVTTDFRGDPLEDRVGKIDEDTVLPSFNLTWSFLEKHKLRFGYSKTLARPNFRELTPVASFSAIASRRIVGNPFLELSEIDNADLRWEWYPTDGELVALSVFRKELTNPIEQTVNALNQQTWQNVSEGEVRGVELEARQKIDLLSGEYTAFSLGGNVSVIESEVTRPDDELSRKLIFDPEIPLVRELQGQSELLVNFDVSWEHYRKGTSITLAYNHTGERLSEISTAQLPDVYERPGDDLDLIFSQTLNRRWKLKFKASNLLGAEDESVHDFLGEEYIYSFYDSGTKYALSFSYSYQ